MDAWYKVATPRPASAGVDRGGQRQYQHQNLRLHPNRSRGPGTKTLRIAGEVPPEVWNRLGTRLLPRLRSGTDLKVGVEFSVTVEVHMAQGFEADLRQILDDLGVTGRVQINTASR